MIDLSQQGWLPKPVRLITKNPKRLTNARIVKRVEDKETILTDCFNTLVMTIAEREENYELGPEYAEAAHYGFEPLTFTLDEFIEQIRDNMLEFEQMRVEEQYPE